MNQQECSDPASINDDEIMKYYGLQGKLGVIRLKSRLARWWVLQTIAKMTPLYEMAVKFQKLRGVEIGNQVYIGPGVNIDDLYPQLVKIEDNVSIGMNTMIFAHSNPTTCTYIKENFYGREVQPVVIHKGAWIAPGCIILAGVEIGENSIVGAGSVVIKNVESYTMVGGVPAKFIKKLQN